MVGRPGEKADPEQVCGGTLHLQQFRKWMGATVVTIRGKPSKLDSLIYNAFVGSVEWAIVFKIATNAKFDNVVALVNGRNG